MSNPQIVVRFADLASGLSLLMTAIGMVEGVVEYYGSTITRFPMKILHNGAEVDYNSMDCRSPCRLPCCC